MAQGQKPGLLAERGGRPVQQVAAGRAIGRLVVAIKGLVPVSRETAHDPQRTLGRIGASQPRTRGAYVEDGLSHNPSVFGSRR